MMRGFATFHIILQRNGVTYHIAPAMISIINAKNNEVPEYTTDAIPKIKTGIRLPLLIYFVILKLEID